VVQTHNVHGKHREYRSRVSLASKLSETMLVKVWYPTTVATLSREIKKVIKGFSGAPPGTRRCCHSNCHDFGYRGVSSEETAALGGAAHLLNFMGPPTRLLGIVLLRDYYHAQTMAGYSIPASDTRPSLPGAGSMKPMRSANMLTPSRPVWSLGLR